MGIPATLLPKMSPVCCRPGGMATRWGVLALSAPGPLLRGDTDREAQRGRCPSPLTREACRVRVTPTAPAGRRGAKPRVKKGGPAEFRDPVPTCSEGPGTVEEELGQHRQGSGARRGRRAY